MQIWWSAGQILASKSWMALFENQTKGQASNLNRTGPHTNSIVTLPYHILVNRAVEEQEVIRVMKPNFRMATRPMSKVLES